LSAPSTSTSASATNVRVRADVRECAGACALFVFARGCARLNVRV
jgi:hypothetical protein